MDNITNDQKNDVFVFWTDRLIWDELTLTWDEYNELDYFLMENDTK